MSAPWTHRITFACLIGNDRPLAHRRAAAAVMDALARLDRPSVISDIQVQDYMHPKLGEFCFIDVKVTAASRQRDSRRRPDAALVSRFRPIIDAALAEPA